jgi:hypothetical protein
MLTPQHVTIHRSDDVHFYSCSREDWGPDFFEKCGRKKGENRNDYESIAEDYRSYCTLDNLGKFLVDECNMRVECERRLTPQICHLIKSVYDSTSYYTLTINFWEDRKYFDLNFESFPFNENKSNVKQFRNTTDWSVETLERIEKELPIDILTDYITEYKKKFVRANMKASDVQNKASL